jgi:hypothetical protein
MKKARKLTRTSFRAFSISGCNLFRVILGLYYNQISQKIPKNFIGSRWTYRKSKYTTGLEFLSNQRFPHPHISEQITNQLVQSFVFMYFELLVHLLFNFYGNVILISNGIFPIENRHKEEKEMQGFLRKKGKARRCLMATVPLPETAA